MCPVLVDYHRSIEDDGDRGHSTKEVWHPKAFYSEGLAVDIALAAAVGYWPDLRGKMEQAQTVAGSDLEEGGNLYFLDMAEYIAQKSSP